MKFYNGNISQRKNYYRLFQYYLVCDILFMLACLFHQAADMTSKLTATAKTNAAAIYVLNTKITINNKSYLMPWH